VEVAQYDQQIAELSAAREMKMKAAAKVLAALEALT
jgi:hypothetical protein